MSFSKVIVSLALPVLFLAVPAASFAKDRSLTVGSTGADVTLLQQALVQLGYFQGQATGYFGELTKKAVMALQAANGLESVGIAGPQTRQLIAGVAGAVTTDTTTPELTLTSNVTEVAPDGSARLTWSTKNVTSCVGSGAWSGPLDTAHGATVGHIKTNSTFTITCTGPNGSVSKSATVTVTGSAAANTPPTPTAQTSSVGGTSGSTSTGVTTTPVTGAAAPTVKLKSNVDSVATNGSVRLSWSSENTRSCTGSWTDGELKPVFAQTIGHVLKTTTYTITCTGSAGAAKASVTVLVDGTTPASTTPSAPTKDPVSVPSTPVGTTSCTPEYYGAKHDGTTNDGVAIQSALDACAGKTVVLGGGTYLSNPLTLHTNSSLEIAKGSTLLATTNKNVYWISSSKMRGFIAADKNVSNIVLTGEGTIDGQGSAWWSKPNDTRPRLVYLTDVSNVAISKLTIRNAPMFNIVPYRARNVLIDGVTITAPSDSPNTDGIDPIDSHNVVIQNVNVSVGDDNIAIKSDAAEKDGSAGTTDIVVRNSTFGTGHGASIGSDTSGGMKNISFENLTFNGTDAGVRVKSSRERGGLLTNVTYKNLTMNNVGRAIQITNYYGSSVNDTVAASAKSVTSTTPKFSNITVDGVVSTNTKKAGEVSGLPESPITGVTLKNITISGSQGMDFYNSNVALAGVSITASNNKPLVKHVGANVTGQ